MCFGVALEALAVKNAVHLGKCPDVSAITMRDWDSVPPQGVGESGFSRTKEFGIRHCRESLISDLVGQCAIANETQATTVAAVVVHCAADGTLDIRRPEFKIIALRTAAAVSRAVSCHFNPAKIVQPPFILTCVRMILFPSLVILILWMCSIVCLLLFNRLLPRAGRS